MNKKILFFSSDYKIGLSFTLSDQAKSLHKIFSQNLICVAGEREQTPNLRSKYQTQGIDLRIINGLDDHNNFLPLCKKIATIVDQEKITIVHVHNNWQLALVSYVKYLKFKKIRIVYSIHGYRHNHRFKSIFARRIIGFALFLFADVVLAGSSELKNAIPYISKKCFLFFQGVDEEIVKINRQRDFKGKLNITFVGQFRYGKNQNIIINAFEKYANQTQDYNFILNFAGQGETFDEIQKLTHNSSIRENIRFLGQLTREEIITLYRATDVAVIATNHETFGFCIAEPFAAGIPVFSRNTGIAKDIIEHGKNGFVFAKDDELFILLKNYLRDNNKLTLITGNQLKIKKSLLWDEINTDYEKLLGLH
jgi:glycosyltransferase involved in cell wall biosynthesis